MGGSPSPPQDEAPLRLKLRGFKGAREGVAKARQSKHLSTAAPARARTHTRTSLCEQRCTVLPAFVLKAAL